MSDKANSLSLILCYVTAHNRCDQQHSGGQIPAGICRRQASPKNGDTAEAEKCCRQQQPLAEKGIGPVPHAVHVLPDPHFPSPLGGIIAGFRRQGYANYFPK